MIKELIEELSEIIAENKSLKFQNELYKNQLIIVAMNEHNENLEFIDLNLLDLDAVKVSIGNNAFHVLDNKNNFIKSFEEIPKKIR